MIVQRESRTHVFRLETIEETSSLYVSDSEATMDDRSLVADIALLKKRLSKLEKVYSVIKKNTSFDQAVSSGDISLKSK